MSWKLQAQAWNCALPMAEKVVLLALANLADDENSNTAWPSIETLAEAAGCSGRNVQRSVRALEAAGHISRVERRGKGVIYTIHPRQTVTPDTQLRVGAP